jgi:hypothetical protein
MYLAEVSSPDPARPPGFTEITMIVARSSELVFTGDHRQRIVSKHNATRPH